MNYNINRIKSLKVLHACFCIGPLLIMIINHFFIRPIGFSGILETLELMSYIGLGIAIVNVLIASYLFKAKVDELGTDINSSNITQYVQAYIIKWAFIEAAILINTLFYFFLNTDPINIVVAILLLIVLYLYRPPMSHQ